MTLRRTEGLPWQFKLTLKFRAKIKELFVTYDIKVVTSQGAEELLQMIARIAFLFTGESNMNLTDHTVMRLWLQTW